MPAIVSTSNETVNSNVPTNVIIKARMWYVKARLWYVVKFVNEKQKPVNYVVHFNRCLQTKVI